MAIAVLEPDQLVHSAEVAGIFDSYDAACQAAHDLHRAGFKHWEVFRSRPPRAGESAIATERWADHPDRDRTEHVRVERLHPTAGYLIGGFGVLGGVFAAWGAATRQDSLTAGILVVVLIGGGAALLGLLAALVMGAVSRRHVTASAEHDGLVLWAMTPNRARETAATDIMLRCGGHHVHGVQGMD